MRALWINTRLCECYHLHVYLTQNSDLDRLKRASNIFPNFILNVRIWFVNFVLQVSPKTKINRWQIWRTWEHSPLLTVRLSVRSNHIATETIKSPFCVKCTSIWNMRTKMYWFRVCKSVHHHTFNWINQPDGANSQVYYLSFKYSSTCFGHPHAHHQELQQLQ
jgi:hypothetical protein